MKVIVAHVWLFSFSLNSNMSNSTSLKCEDSKNSLGTPLLIMFYFEREKKTENANEKVKLNAFMYDSFPLLGWEMRRATNALREMSPNSAVWVE